jgi:glycosyltransferase involved in cell wall biosynthesis
MTPHIDILLATYNGEAFLSTQIQSILEQTYPYIHLFIRDDASNDGTATLLQEIQEKFPEKITLLKNPINLSSPAVSPSQGAVQNFAHLLSQSRADYVMFADQDDLWLPTKVADTLDKMLQMEQELGPQTPLLVHTDLCVVDSELRTCHPSFWKYSQLKIHAKQFSRMLMQNLVTGCTMMLNRSLVELTQPISAEAVMHDWWIALTAAAFGRIGEVKNPTILYRQHGKNHVGAKDRRLLSLAKQGIKQIFLHAQTVRRAQEKQALAFQKQFKNQLSLKQKNTLQAFYAIPLAHLLHRIYLMSRYRLWKHGIMRNLALFFLPYKKT